MGGRDYCSVVGCNNRRSDLPKGFAFHQFPKGPLSRRNAWIRATGRTLTGKNKFVVTDNTKICGSHFLSGRKSQDPTNIDYSFKEFAFGNQLSSTEKRQWAGGSISSSKF